MKHTEDEDEFVVEGPELEQTEIPCAECGEGDAPCFLHDARNPEDPDEQISLCEDCGLAHEAFYEEADANAREEAEAEQEDDEAEEDAAA